MPPNRPLPLAQWSPTKLRLLLASAAGHPASPMTLAQKVATLTRLHDLHWKPTPDDTPCAFATLAAWARSVCGVEVEG